MPQEEGKGARKLVKTDSHPEAPVKKSAKAEGEANQVDVNMGEGEDVKMMMERMMNMMTTMKEELRGDIHQVKDEMKDEMKEVRDEVRESARRAERRKKRGRM